MDHDFWLDKWVRNEIGFHEEKPHPMLTRFWDDLGVPAAGRVFVPLCGKSNDMRWLRERGHEIVGVELSEIALTDFFEENGLEASRSSQGPFEVFEAPGYRLLRGDYFELTPSVIGPVAGAYDRAALVALPPELRADYTRHLAGLLPGAEVLLVTLQYTPGLLQPPPFAILDDEVASLYAGFCEIERLGSDAATVKGKPCQETAFHLRFA